MMPPNTTPLLCTPRATRRWTDNQQYDDASKYYSATLSVHPANTQRIFILRSKVSMTEGLWEDAVEDANEASFILSREFIHANVIIRR